MQISKATKCSRYFSVALNQSWLEEWKHLTKIRTIGLLAHIDSGKTTTTERMLYFSGEIKSMGEVHLGNTVTDFMPQERKRGITVASAAVMFPWNKHDINLIDTPGHIDFTMQIEQILSVIDSAVIIMDASSGVQAQTLTVWNQIDRQKLPRLIYLNKFDRRDADLAACLSSIKSKLSLEPLVTQLPVQSSSRLEGVVDLVNMELTQWSVDNRQLSKMRLPQTHAMANHAVDARSALVDRLSSLDDTLASLVLSQESLEIHPLEVTAALRRATISQTGVPLLVGSSYKNIGIHGLLDGVVDYLPSPLESLSSAFLHYDGFAARAFKILHDQQRGPITYLRVLSGQISKGQKLYNISRDQSEICSRLYVAFADEFNEVESVSGGYFVGVTGFKSVRPGDLILKSAGAEKQLSNRLKEKLKIKDDQIYQLVNAHPIVPKPVFFCSVEPHSMADCPKLDKALEELSKEDPSFTVTRDEQTGQTILAGMGELHLEIVIDRMRTNYNVQVDAGPINIVYKEQVISQSSYLHEFNLKIGNYSHTGCIELGVAPGVKKDLVSIDYIRAKDEDSGLAGVSPKHMALITSGVKTAMSRGPLFSSEVIDVHFYLRKLNIHRSIPDPVLTSVAFQSALKAISAAGTKLLEPVMQVNILVEESFLTLVTSDLSRRRGAKINRIEPNKHYKEVDCDVPLAELLGYSNHLRSLTSGHALLSLSFLEYRAMSQDDQENLIRSSQL